MRPGPAGAVGAIRATLGCAVLGSAVLGCAVLVGCGGSMMPTVSTPVFSPAAGTYTAPQTVTLSSATPGAALYYTTDGTAPTNASTKYTGALAVNATETIEAIASEAGDTTSAVSTARYVINLPAPTVSTTSYAFPADVVGNALTETVVTVTNPGTQTVTLTAAIAGDPSLTLVPSADGACGATLAAGAACSLVVQYLPVTAGTQTATLTLGYSGPVIGSETVALSGTATTPAAGMASATTNPLVALYSVTPGYAAAVTVQFGLTTSYGQSTLPVATTPASPGAAVNVEVAGMRANTLYHMRAAIAYAGGNTAYTPDTTFTTGTLPAALAALQQQLVAAVTPGLTPQPGIELLEPVAQSVYQPYATDLEGNIIWYYPWADWPGSPYLNNGLKELPNGDMVGVFSVNDSATFSTAPPNPNLVVVREFDLIGNTVRQITVAQLNTELAAAGYTQSNGSPLVLEDFHHDITPLPNGHWLILANTVETFTLNNTPTAVLGDVVIDVNPALQPVFVWNEFDHLSVQRQPLRFPDWTHSNAVVYSPSDGNFIVSIRHQNWLVKVNYNNGAGDGSILWHLGYHGDFALLNADGSADANPYDWQYAQHGPSLVDPTASAGTYDLVLMDNGDDRIQAGNITNCTNPADCYTTVPKFTINESALTVTVASRVVEPTTPVDLYSSFGGNAEVLANGDLEYDLCGPATGARVVETEQDSGQTQVWTLTEGPGDLYRAFRQPSLYDGVQWP